jgi:hypothetical protein
MRLARIVPLLLLGACSSSKSSVPLEAPNVKFNKALIIAAMGPEHRRDVETRAAEEIQKRRPHVQVIPSYGPFPDVNEVSETEFATFVKSRDIDMVVTIVPFAEAALTSHDGWDDVANDHVGHYVEDMKVQALVGRYGIQVVGWEVATKKPVYAKTRQTVFGEAAGPNGVVEFTVDAVTRDI